MFFYCSFFLAKKNPKAKKARWQFAQANQAPRTLFIRNSFFNVFMNAEAFRANALFQRMILFNLINQLTANKISCEFSGGKEK